MFHHLLTVAPALVCPAVNYSGLCETKAVLKYAKLHHLVLSLLHIIIILHLITLHSSYTGLYCTHNYSAHFKTSVYKVNFYSRVEWTGLTRLLTHTLHHCRGRNDVLSPASPRPAVPLYRCTAVPVYRCTGVP